MMISTPFKIGIACILLCLFSIGFYINSTNDSDTVLKNNESVYDYVSEENYKALSPFFQEIIKSNIEGALANPISFASKQSCWSPDTDPKIIEAFHEAGHSLKHSLSADLEKYQLATRWGATANSGGGLSQGDPTILSWSYVADGTTITSDCNGQNSNSNFIAFFNGIFGGPTVAGDFTTAPWHNIFVNMFAAWESVSGLSFVYEPNDDGAPFANPNGANPGIVGVRGDHRIGGNFIDGNSGVLACNYFPSSGDMIIDTGDNFYQNNQGVGTLNVLQHEIGHGLGMAHVCPINQTKLMEPFVTTAFVGPQPDDILAVNRGYGDIEEPNNSSGAATDLGALNLPSVNNYNGLSVDDNSDIDFYEFNINSASDITITLSSVGESYLEGAQNNNGSCQAGTNYDAGALSNLEVDLLSSNGSTVLASANGNAAGIDEVITTTIGAGTFFVRIRQTGNVNEAQMYDFEIDLDPIPLNAPVASFTASDDGPILICTNSGFPISFTDTSQEFPDSWSWTFAGAGVSPTTSTDQFPTVTVTSGGTLDITLVSSNSVGSSNNTATQSIVINERNVNAFECIACLDFTGSFLLLNAVTPSCATGCTPVSNTTPVQSSRAYLLAGLTGGEEYTFDICSGYDPANWEAVLTIGEVSSSGIIENSEFVAAKGCSITFTCPASGDYVVVISEVDNCGGAEVTVNNGTPTLRCTGLQSTSFFTDLGGTSFDYFNNLNLEYVLCPDNVGEFIEITFTAFAIEGDSDGNSPTDCYDIMNIYNGDNTSAPQIGGEFCDAPGPGSPGTVTSTDATGCLTVEFTSDGFVTLAGWEATVQCSSPSVCPPDYANGNAITGIETNSFDYETDGAIESTQIITNNAVVDYDSGTDILLNPDFEVVLGAEFHAFIDGCGGNALSAPNTDLSKINSMKNNTSYGLKQHSNGEVIITRLAPNKSNRKR